MKKEYINPETEVVMLKYNNQLLAGSVGDKNNEDPDEWGAPALDFDNNMFGF